MHSILNYSKNKFNIYNSLQSNINYPVILNESKLFEFYGSQYDSIVNKLNIYVNRKVHSLKYGSINESFSDVLFDINESYAARDFLINICNRYIEGLCDEYGVELVLNESFGDWIKKGTNNIKVAFKKGGEKVKNAVNTTINEIEDKLSQVAAFIKDLIKGVIQSAKDLFNRITDMMLKFGEGFDKLSLKLGYDQKESYAAFQTYTAQALKDELSAKENVYESLGQLVKENQDLITEKWSLFSKKDKQEPKKFDDEFQDAADSTEGKPLKEIAKGVFTLFWQIAGYYIVTALLPAIVTILVPPPMNLAAAAITETIVKLAWSGMSIFKTVKKIKETVKSETWKTYSKGVKIAMWALWLASLIFAGRKFGQATIDAIKIGDFLSKGFVEKILPSDSVLGVYKILNSFKEKITGDGFSTYDDTMTAVENAQKEIIEEVQETVSTNDENVNTAEYFDDAELDKAKEAVNTAMQGEKSVGWDKALAKKFDDIKDKFPQGYSYIASNIRFKGGWDAWFKTDAGKEFLSKYGDYFQKFVVQSSVNGQSTYSYIFGIKDPIPEGAPFKTLMELKNILDSTMKQASDANGGGGSAEILGTVLRDGGVKNIIKTIVKPANFIKMAKAGFGGFLSFPSVKNSKGFRVRLGTEKNNYLYEVESDDIVEMSYDELKSKYESNNPGVFKKMASTINKNYKELLKIKEDLSKGGKLDKKKKKQLNLINQQLEIMKDEAKDAKMLVFLSSSKPEEEKEKNENTEEVKVGESKFRSINSFIKEAEESENKEENTEEKKEKSSGDKRPVFFVNPLTLSLGDLAPNNKRRGPRSTPRPVKGFLASYCFYPRKEGLKGEDIIKMFTDIIKKSLTIAFGMCIDTPCIENPDGKGYIENENSKFKGKKREDFGLFTNDELTQIFNNPDIVGKFLDGKYYSGGGQKVKNKDEELTEKTKERYKDYIENNEDIKEIIDKSKSLKKYLVDDEGKVNDKALDKIMPLLIRTENNYITSKDKSGIKDKITSLFKKKKEEDDDFNFDPKELARLSYRIASVDKKFEKNRLKVKQNESLSELDIDNLLVEEGIIECQYDYLITVSELLNEYSINESFKDEEVEITETLI